MRPIDADTLLELPELVDCEKIDTARVRKDIVNAPTVNAVPVVRCGECKFFRLHPNDDFADNAGICTKHSHYCDFSKCEADRFITDFCSYGERKDGEK